MRALRHAARACVLSCLLCLTAAPTLAKDGDFDAVVRSVKADCGGAYVKASGLRAFCAMSSCQLNDGSHPDRQKPSGWSPDFFHEPAWSPGFGRSGPPEGGTPYRWHDPDGFMIPMHGRKAEEAFHERPYSTTGPFAAGTSVPGRFVMMRQDFSSPNRRQAPP